MLMTEEKQPGLISCDWVENSPEFFTGGYKFSICWLFMESNILICRWFAQAHASENCPIKSSLKAESTQLLSDHQTVFSKTKTMWSDWFNQHPHPHNCLKAPSLERLYSCQACSIQYKKTCSQLRKLVFSGAPSPPLVVLWLLNLLNQKSWFNSFSQWKIAGVTWKFNRECSSSLFLCKRTPFRITVLRSKD